MNAKFKKLDGVKYLVDSKGVFLKDEAGAKIEADDTATEFVETAPATEVPAEAEIAEAKAYFKTIATETAGEMMKSLSLPQELAKAMAKEISGMATKKVDVEFTKGLNDPKEKAVSITKDAVIEGLKNAKGKVGADFQFTAKTLTELSSLTGELPEEDRQAGITGIAKREPYILDLVQPETTTSALVSWVEINNETGAPATTAELAVFPEKDYTYQVLTTTVVKIAVQSKMSNEVLEDLPQLVSHVQGELYTDLRLTVDEKLLSGTGVADLTGILAVAPTLNTTAFSGTVVAPNFFDVIRIAINNIRVAGKGKFRANAILMNTVDVTALDLTKATNGEYVLPPFTTAEGTVIKGVRVIENDTITAGTFVVADMTRFHVPVRRGISLQVATENSNDFERDMVTVRLSMRLASYIKANENGAFVQGDFSTAIADIAA